MANYEWIIHVIDDLEKFSKQEKLENLYQLLIQAHNAVKLDIQALENVDSVSQRHHAS